ncbi:MAG: hypothetical protein ABI697_10945 [Devosia sp.]
MSDEKGAQYLCHCRNAISADQARIDNHDIGPEAETGGYRIRLGRLHGADIVSHFLEDILKKHGEQGLIFRHHDPE